MIPITHMDGLQDVLSYIFGIDLEIVLSLDWMVF